MKKVKSLTDLLVMQLNDLYYTEKQLMKALPKLQKNAHSEELKQVIEDHLQETEDHINRLEQVFEELNVTARSRTNLIVSAMMEEVQEILAMKDNFDPGVLDAAIIGQMQKTEHFEIACYGTARAYANLLDYQKAERLLQQTLDEEYSADQKLNSVAEEINSQIVEEQS